MSRRAVTKFGLGRPRDRCTFVVFVSREADVAKLKKGGPTSWTLPSKALPGDRVLVYKPGETRGWAGRQKEPFEAFVAAGIVYGKPKRRAPGEFNGPIAEITWFPSSVKRPVVAGAFPEWTWLRQMQGLPGGVEVQPAVEAELFSLIDRLAFSRPQKTTKRNDR